LPERKRKEAPAREGEPRGRGFWSGTIAFGLVSVPVQLYPANRTSSISLRMVDEDGTPLQRQFFCAREERPVSRDELVRGYEVEPDRYVVVTDEELRALAPEKSREIDLRRFVPLSQLDPFFFERAYYLVPEEGGSKAYRLLAAAMESSRRAGIATFVMRDREYLVAIISEDGMLRAETLRFPEELRSPTEVGLAKPKSAPSCETQALVRAIEALGARTLNAEELTDDRSERLRELAERKRAAGEDVVRAPDESGEEGGAEIIDLMAVLKKSLGHTAAARTAATPQRTPRTRAPRARGRTSGARKSATSKRSSAAAKKRATSGKKQRSTRRSTRKS
jgi:DNA end-binding protein Ku